MPDDSDYARLAWLIAHPEKWTEDDVSSVQFMILNQKRAMADLHPKDVKGRTSMQDVVNELEGAMRTYLARRPT